jgi:hypothetical protein
MKRGVWEFVMRQIVVALLCMVVAAPSMAKVFTYKKKNGDVVITDDFFALPAGTRAELMDVLVQEAEKKFSPTEIGMMKQSGDWPPLELLRGSLDKRESVEVEVDWEELGASAEKVRKRWSGEFGTYRRLKKSVEEKIPKIDAQLKAIEDQRMHATAQDMATGMVGKEGGKVHELETQKAELMEQKSELEWNKKELPKIRRRINMGELYFTLDKKDRKKVQGEWNKK